jgi:predicted nucleic acid-binding protein
MSGARPLVLDANILVRAALGPKARGIIERHASHAEFFVPAWCVAEAREHLPVIVAKRNLNRPGFRGGCLVKVKRPRQMSF